MRGFLFKFGFLFALLAISLQLYVIAVNGQVCFLRLFSSPDNEIQTLECSSTCCAHQETASIQQNVSAFFGMNKLQQDSNCCVKQLPAYFSQSATSDDLNIATLHPAFASTDAYMQRSTTNIRTIKHAQSAAQPPPMLAIVRTTILLI